MIVDAPPTAEIVVTQRSRRVRVLPVTASGSVQIVVWVLVALGVVLRSLQYAMNPSLTGDEAMLALNVIRRSLHGLLGIMDFSQAAPSGFLVLEEYVESLFGGGEYSLRAVPFAASLVAMIVFPLLSRSVLGLRGTAVAVGLFALSDSIIYYAGTAKQYSLDIAMAVILTWLALRVLERMTHARVSTLIAVGAVAVWLSHPAAFVLAAIGVSLLVTLAIENQWRLAALATGGGLLWLGSLAISYAITRRGVEHLEKSFSGSTAFFGGGDDVAGQLHEYLGIFRYSAGISNFSLFGVGDPARWAAGAAAVLFLIGCIALSSRKPAYAGVLFGPAVIAVAVSAAQQYPLLGRTALFVAPAAVAGIAAGAATIARRVRRPIAGAIVARAAVGLVFVSLAIPVVRHIDDARSREELKPVLQYLAKAQRPGDALYLYYASQYTFRYYLSCGCFDHITAAPVRRGLWPLTRYVGGSAQWAPALVSRPPYFHVGVYRGRDPSVYVSDLRGLKGRPRVWVILSDLSYADRRFLLDQLGRLGRMRASFKPGEHERAAGVYLYDLK